MKFEDEVKQKIESIETRYYITVVSVFVCGLLAHLYQFTNKNFNYDELGQTPAGFGAGISLGRWGLQLIGDMVGVFFRTYSIPMVNGMIALIFIALSAVCIVKTFDISDKVCCFLIGGIIATFPALVSTYFFMFTAPYYGFAMLLACVSGMLLTKGIDELWQSSEIERRSSIKKFVVNTLLGIASLTLATGIYQSYCSVTLCIILLNVIMRLYEDGEDIKRTLIVGITYCVEFTISILLYLLGTKIAVKVTGIQLDDYRGMSDIGTINIGGLFTALKCVYKNYLLLMTPRDVYQINPIYIVNVIFVLVNCVCIFLIWNKIRSKSSIINKVFFIVMLVLFPVATFFPEVLTQGAGGVYSIMTYAVVFVFILPIIMYDKYRCGLTDTTRKDYAGRVLCISTFACILVYIWFANGNYQALQYTTYHDIAYFETLATQVKSLEGYTADMPVAFVGDGFDDPTFTAGGLMDSYFDIEGKWPTNVNYFNNIYLWTSYLGYTPEIIEFKDSEYLLEVEQIKKMPSYPESGSIAIVDGTVVIKGCVKQ